MPTHPTIPTIFVIKVNDVDGKILEVQGNGQPYQSKKLNANPQSNVDQIISLQIVRAAVGNPTQTRCVVDQLGNIWCP